MNCSHGSIRNTIVLYTAAVELKYPQIINNYMVRTDRVY